MQNVFVTGATGFIGKVLVRELIRRETRVKCLVRAQSSSPDWPANCVTSVVGELENPESYRTAVRDCDTVIHLAARVHAPRRSDLFRTNVAGTAALSAVCREAENPPHLIYMSSIAAAGPPLDGKSQRDEADRPDPVSDYGRSKWQGELELQKWANEMPTTVFRPGVVYGPGDPKFAQLFRTIHRTRMHFVVGYRTPPLSVVFVDDLVSLILDGHDRFETLPAASSGASSEKGVYFVCDDSEFPTYSELGIRIGQSMGHSVFVCPMWHWIGFATGATSQAIHRLGGSSSVLNVDKVREAVARSWVSSASKARTQLGFNPPQPLDERLRETADGFREQGWL